MESSSIPKYVRISAPQARLFTALRKVVGKEVEQEIRIGKYTVDIRWAPLIVEVEGLSHENPNTAHDELERLHFIESKGYTVIRIRAHQIGRDPSDYVDMIRQYHRRLLETETVNIKKKRLLGEKKRLLA